MLWGAGVAGAQDLPFNSGSTGADGPFHVNAAFSPGRYYHAMAFDAARGQVVMFGGNSQSPSFSTETWTLQGQDWVKRTPATTPPGLQLPGMVYDSARQETVLFGGFGSGGPVNETWIWNGTNWSKRVPATIPGPRGSPGIAYDPIRQVVVMFGGYATGGGLLDDTWVWNGTNWNQRTPALPSPNPRYALARFLAVFGGIAR